MAFIFKNGALVALGKWAGFNGWRMTGKVLKSSKDLVPKPLGPASPDHFYEKKYPKQYLNKKRGPADPANPLYPLGGPNGVRTRVSGVRG